MTETADTLPISIPLRYNLEEERLRAIVMCQYFNSTKVQFGDEASGVSTLQRTEFQFH